MNPHYQLGKDAEQLALEWFLKNKQSRLLARNYRCRWGEIDLVFEELEELVFVEVRARSAQGWMNGVQSVDRWKCERLEKTAHHFLYRYRGSAKRMRFDLLSWDGSTWCYLPNFWLT